MANRNRRTTITLGTEPEVEMTGWAGGWNEVKEAQFRQMINGASIPKDLQIGDRVIAGGSDLNNNYIGTIVSRKLSRGKYFYGIRKDGEEDVRGGHWECEIESDGRVRSASGLWDGQTYLQLLQPERETMREIKVGDKVRMREDYPTDGSTYQNEWKAKKTVLTVLEQSGASWIVTDNDKIERTAVDRKRLTLAEPILNKKYKVGDRLRIKKSDKNYNLKKGEDVVVRDVLSSGYGLEILATGRLITAEDEDLYKPKGKLKTFTKKNNQYKISPTQAFVVGALVRVKEGINLFDVFSLGDRSFTDFDANMAVIIKEVKDKEIVVDYPFALNKHAHSDLFEVVVDKDKKRLIDTVVISKEKKDQILEAISQKNNTDLIFKVWGFEEVFEKGTAISLLFYGIPGTGKTLMAQAISEELGMKFEIIGAAEIQTSEPGGAERKIKEIFKKAGKDTVVLLDECDSLLMDRNQVGHIMSSQINTLLSEIERFEGVVIFTTNRLGRLDPALERRISGKIEFEFPDEKARKKIWERMLPKKAPLAKDVDFNQLAEYPVTGGSIKNCVLNAARRAAFKGLKEIDHESFVSAIETEMRSIAEFASSKEDSYSQGNYVATRDIDVAEGNHLEVVERYKEFMEEKGGK